MIGEAAETLFFEFLQRNHQNIARLDFDRQNFGILQDLQNVLFDILEHDCLLHNWGPSARVCALEEELEQLVAQV